MARTQLINRRTNAVLLIFVNLPLQGNWLRLLVFIGINSLAKKEATPSSDRAASPLFSC